MRIEGDFVVVVVPLSLPRSTHIREWTISNAKPFDHDIRRALVSVPSKAVDGIPDW